MAERDLNPIALTEELLTRIAHAATKNPQTVSRVVGQIADELGTSVEDVIKAVRDAAGVVGAGLLGLAKTAGAAIESAISAGTLTAPGTAVASAASTAAGASTATSASSGGGIAAWFTGMNVAAQVATVIGAVVLTSAVAQTVSSPDLSLTAAEGFKAVAVQVDGVTRIVSVRHTNALGEGIAPCRFRHGGNDCDGAADIVELDPVAYPTAVEATEALCEMFDGPRFAPALSDGWSVPFDGSTVTLDDWGHVDLARCDEVIEATTGG